MSPGHIPPQYRGEVGAEFDRNDLGAGPDQRGGSLTGPRTDLHYSAPRPDAGQLDEIAHQRGRIARAGTGVACCVLVESRPQVTHVAMIVHSPAGRDATGAPRPVLRVSRRW